MAELQNSHIVSSFLWLNSRLFETKKQYKVFAINDPSLRLPDLQNGFKEHLLCWDCEQLFSKWEKYAGPIYTNKQTPLHGLSSRQFIVGQLSYYELKLFIMSILWRISITSHPYYAHVNLGVFKNELLRQALYAKKPFGWRHYGCIFSVLDEGSALFAPAFTLGDSSQKTVNVVIAGVHWEIFVSGKKPEPYEEEFFLKPIGTMRMALASVARDFPYLQPLIKDNIARHLKEKAV